jgi:hypothetical protein
MKIALGVLGLVFLFSMPAQAQISGSSISFGASGPTFGSMIHNQPARFDVVVAKGTTETFEPSGFVSYDVAIAAGQAALAQRQKTVAQLAEETRNERKARQAATMTRDPALNIAVPASTTPVNATKPAN